MSTDDAPDYESVDGDSELRVERPDGFEQIPHGLWMAGSPSRVSPSALVTYAALSRRQFKNLVPSRATLAKDMDVTTRSVDTRLNELVEKGWLLITPRFRNDGDKQQTSNDYTLLFVPITSPDDPRLDRHHRRRAAFEAGMAEREAANREKRGDATTASKGRSVRAVTGPTLTLGTVKDSSPGGVKDSSPPPVKDSSPLPVKDSSPQEQDPSSVRPKTSTAAAAASSAGDDLTGKRAEKFAREWHDHYAATFGPPVGWKHIAVRNLIRDCLTGGYTETEIKTALVAAGVSCPSKQQMERNLNDLRAGRAVGQRPARPDSNLYVQPNDPNRGTTWQQRTTGP